MTVLRCLSRPGLVALCLCSCSFLGLYETPPADLPSDVSEACAGMAGAACGDLLGCCTWSHDDTALCADLFTGGCVDDYAGRVADGLIAVDAASWQLCLDEIGAFFGDCATEELPENRVCSSYWVGQIDQGEPCETSSECSPGLECFSTCLDPSSLPVAGEPCREEECEDEPCVLICAADHFCDAGGVCRRFAGLQEPCEVIDENYFDDCGEDLTCGDALVCIPDLQDGAECAVSRQCRSYDCEDGWCVGSDTFDWCELDF